jgi:hypothetical protein
MDWSAFSVARTRLSGEKAKLTTGWDDRARPSGEKAMPATGWDDSI